ncbi:hypothetical protein QTI04_12090 [Variovorax sp. J22R115]|nr:hypothetical protein [Variovorax sp. J22R115]
MMLLLVLVAPVAMAEPAFPGARPTVTVVEQSARDSERMRVLHDELRQSRRDAESLARRRAERLAAGDATGADEAEAQGARVLQDIDALKREIGTAQPGPAARGSTAAPPAAAAPATASKAAPVKSRPPARWWDVYGRAAAARAAADSSATASGVDATRHALTRRLE